MAFKTFIQKRLEKSVGTYFKKHPDVRLVAVVGSVGKTSTKIAIGTVLHEKYRVRLHEGNHNSELSAPLAILGIEYPTNIRSYRQWWRVFRAIHKRIKQPSDVDIIVQELGTDRIGQLPHFGTYLSPDVAVITSVAPEHMEYFKTMDAVAKEELSAAQFSKSALINRDDIAGVYAEYLQNATVNTYGTTAVAEYRFETNDFTFQDGFTGIFSAPELPAHLPVTLHLIGDYSTRAAVAAGAIGVKMGMSPEEIARGMAKIYPVHGRMNVLRGVDNSIIIDDTYNSSPLAAASALRELYKMNAPQRIAVIGSMNELGDMSAEAHAELGRLCDPIQLAQVVTVGEDAARYFAPSARASGCHVVSFQSALDAGAYVRGAIEPGAVVLFKGSQGGIYLEEAVKIVLHSTDDEEKLVRQSPAWLDKKRSFFASLEPDISQTDE